MTMTARIGINGTAISRNGKGISNYQKNIILALMELGSPHEYFVFLNKAKKVPFTCGKQNWHFIQIQIWNHLVWKQLQLPYLAWKFKLDLFHDIFDRYSFLLNIPLVLFLFEIPHHRYGKGKSNMYSRISEWLLVSMFPQNLERARRILVSSLNTRNDLIERFWVEPEKVQVNYPGCGKCICQCA